jgi:acyl-CoA thioesterase-2
MARQRTLIENLALERLDRHLFRGTTPRNLPRSRIFGGQVLAQSLLAAYETVEGRLCHSLHAYFIRPGEPSVPIIFEVDTARDGGSFTTRRVTAIQDGKQIFNMACSFHVRETGLEHQIDAPAGPHWSKLPDETEQKAIDLKFAPEHALPFVQRKLPLEIRVADSRFEEVSRSPTNRTWMRAREPIGDDQRLHQVAATFGSDISLLGVNLRPHAMRWHSPHLQATSLDHALWFHRPINFNAWNAYATESPIATGGRALARGGFYDENGALLISVAQEGLLRIRPG